MKSQIGTGSIEYITLLLCTYSRYLYRQHNNTLVVLPYPLSYICLWRCAFKWVQWKSGLYIFLYFFSSTVPLSWTLWYTLLLCIARYLFTHFSPHTFAFMSFSNHMLLSLLLTFSPPTYFFIFSLHSFRRDYINVMVNVMERLHQCDGGTISMWWSMWWSKQEPSRKNPELSNYYTYKIIYGFLYKNSTRSI